MSKSNYAGLDYSGPGSTVNRDPETGIRYGVISQHSIQSDVMSDIWLESRDLSYEAAVEEAKKRLASAFSNDGPSDRETDFWAVVKDLCGTSDIQGAVRELMEVEKEEDLWEVIGQHFNDRYESGDSHDWLWEEGGYQLTNCLQTDVLVSKSPYLTYAQFCSPCVPGAGNLDHAFPWNPVLEPRLAAGNTLYCRLAEKAGFPKVLCLGHDFFENDEAPYPVFSVATGKRVVMVEKKEECPSCRLRREAQEKYDALPVTAPAGEYLAGDGNYGLTESESKLAREYAHIIVGAGGSQGGDKCLRCGGLGYEAKKEAQEQ